MARLVIADDHPLFLRGLHSFLSENGHEVSYIARTASDAADGLADQSSDALLINAVLNGESAIDLLRTLREAGNAIPVILVAGYISGQEAVTAIRLGVNGIVLKSNEPERLLTCLQAVLSGSSWTAPEVMEAALHHSLAPQRTPGQPELLLTGRELEIARLVRQGFRNRDIAQRCNLTEGTVKAHLHSIFRKLEVGSRSELILKMLELDSAG